MKRKRGDPANEFQGKLSAEEVRVMFEQMKEQRKKRAPALRAGVKAPQEQEVKLEDG
ncbi:hypothetical protein [Herbaspirillum huttiense]|uniref:Uncharacterized protein n=1 Tax=Herbaspirillum huttiense subsp. lycopersici TaxID=3074428 RepID=A0ABU2EGZ7_9BURK|nr:hypothetical protein [Herbaspirillum huttiense]MDR9847057.1 hypothetical protein [Herbaspirillum huttiense SE1]